MKRWFLLCFAMTLLLCFGARGEAGETPVMINASLCAMLTPDYQTIVPPGVYGSIESLGNGLYAAYRLADQVFVVIDATGAVCGTDTYAMLRAEGGAIVFGQGSLYGVMDGNFTVVAPCEYTCIVSNGAGGFVALRTDPWDDTPDGVYLIRTDGRESATGVKVLGYLSEFNEGLMPMLSSNNGKYGYLGTDGQWDIQPQYAYADFFHNGRAMAMLDSGSGVIDGKGNWLISPKYDWIDMGQPGDDLIVATNYERGVYLYTVDNMSVTAAVTPVAGSVYATNFGSCAYLYMEDSTRLIDRYGKTLFEGGAFDIMVSLDGDTLILSVGEWGENAESVRTIDGERLTQDYQMLSPLTRAGDTQYYSFCTFDTWTEYSDVLDAEVVEWDENSVRYGVIDQYGNTVTDALYEEVTVVGDQLLCGVKSETMTLLDLNGTIVWQG